MRFVTFAIVLHTFPRLVSSSRDRVLIPDDVILKNEVRAHPHTAHGKAGDFFYNLLSLTRIHIIKIELYYEIGHYSLSLYLNLYSSFYSEIFQRE